MASAAETTTTKKLSRLQMRFLFSSSFSFIFTNKLSASKFNLLAINSLFSTKKSTRLQINAILSKLIQSITKKFTQQQINSRILK